MRNSVQPQRKVFYGVILIVAAGFLFFLRHDIASMLRFVFYLREEFVGALLGFVSAAIILFGFGLLLSLYLSHGLGDLVLAFKDRSEGPEVSKESRAAAERVTGSLLARGDRREIVEAIRHGFSQELGGEFLRQIEEVYGKSVVARAKLDELRRRFDATSRRLEAEIEALGRRGNLNLIIGSLTTIAGLGLLSYMVFTAKVDPKEPSSILSYYLPRISLIIFIEVFAYFFLRLYRSSLGEIKHFQNELTNVDLKFSALEGALLWEEKDALKAILLEFSATERNFVLEKDQTTVELEKERNDATTLREVVGALVKIVPTRQSST